MKTRQTHQAIKYIIIIVGLHTGIVVLHGLAHVGTGVSLSFFENAFVTGFFLLAPFLALLFLHSRWQRTGALVLLLSMLGAVLFGFWNHFLAPGADQIAEVPPGAWHLPFLVTSILLAVLELVGIGAGGWCLSVLRRSPNRRGHYHGSSRPQASEAEHF
jgi:hypothetical protein